MKTLYHNLLLSLILIWGFTSPAVLLADPRVEPDPLASENQQSCENIPLASFDYRGPCCECGDTAPPCGDIPGGVGSDDSALTEDGFSPFGVKLSMSQGFSGVVDSGRAGLGGIPAGCSGCGGSDSIPGDSQMMRFRWSRLWWSTWQHVGSLGRGMYSGYDYYVIKSLDTIEFRDPNTGITERFIDSGGSFIPAPGVKFRSLVTEATATHVTIRQPGGMKLRFEVTNYLENGAYNRCRIEYIEDINGNRITFTYTLPATNATSSVMKWSSAVDPYGRTTTFSYIVWSGLNVIDRVTLPDSRTIDYVYNVDNTQFSNKVKWVST